MKNRIERGTGLYAENLRTIAAREIEFRLTPYIFNLGIPPHVSGYNYLRDAVIELLLEPAAQVRVIKYVTKQNDRNTSDYPQCCVAKRTIARKTDDLTEPKIPPKPLEQGGTGGISVFMPARRGCARARPFPDGIPAPVRCVSYQTKGCDLQDDFCAYRTVKVRICQDGQGKSSD